MAEQIRGDTRKDLMTAYYVEQGLKLCARQGMHPALLFMEHTGVPRPVALQVLCSPEHFRKQSDTSGDQQAA